MKRSIAIILAIIMTATSMIAATNVVSANTGDPVELPPGSGYWETAGDWFVDTSTSFSNVEIWVQGDLTVNGASALLTLTNCLITIEGDLIIENAGTLTLRGTEVRILQPGLVDGVYNIYVRTGGVFTATDIDGIPSTDDGSLITAVGTTYEYDFTVETNAGAFSLVNSEISQCGYNDANPGLTIEINNVLMRDSHIFDSYNGTTFDGATLTSIYLKNMKYEDNVNGVAVHHGAVVTFDDSWLHSSSTYEVAVIDSDVYIYDTTIDSDHDSERGIWLYNNGTANIYNSRIMDANDYNIYVQYYSYLNIQDSNVFSASDDGIYIDDWSDADISNNEIFSNTDANIYLDDFSTAEIFNNDLFANGNSDEGVWVNDGSYANIYNNKIWDNGEEGIQVEDANASITNNWIYSNNWDGIYLNDADECYIADNEIIENAASTTYAGIQVDGGSMWNDIENNLIQESYYYNIRLEGNSHNNTFSDNMIYDITSTGSTYAGVYINGAGTRDNTFDSNAINMNYYGIYMINSPYNYFVDNNIDLNDYRGVYLNNADFNLFEYNTITRSGNGGANHGLYIEQTSGDNEFYYNSLSNRVNILCNNGTVVDNTEFDYNYYSDYTGFDTTADWIGDTGDYTIPGTTMHYDAHPQTKISPTGGNATTYASIGTSLNIDTSRDIHLPAQTPNAGSRTIPQVGIWYEYNLYMNDDDNPNNDNVYFHGDGPDRSFVDGYHAGNVFEFEDCDYIRFDSLSIDNGSGDGIYWEFYEGEDVQIWDTDYNLNPQIDITNCEFESSGSDGIEIGEFDNYGFQYLSDTGDAFQPVNVFDLLGNQHIFWVDPWDDNGAQIWYMMTDLNGNVLINGTAITPYNNDYDLKRPIPLVDSQNHINLVWKDDRFTHESIDTAHDLFFMRLNPYLDDRDGSPANPDVIKVVYDTQIITFPLDDDGYISYENELQMAGADIDSDDNIHLFWCEEDIEDWLYYNKIDRNGNTLIGPNELIFYDGNTANSNARPDLTVDNNDNLHLVWTDEYLTGGDDNDGDDELFYAMLDKFGNKLIDRTMISNDDDYVSQRGQVMVDSQNIVHVVWNDNGNDNDGPEVMYTKFNPYVDDMDGDRAMMANMRLVPNKYISGYGVNTDDEKSRHPYTAMDSNDEIHVVWHEKDRDYEVTYAKLDNDGNILDRFDITPYDLIDDPTYGDEHKIAVDQNNMPHIVWGDDSNYDIAYYNPYNTMYGSLTMNINDCNFIDQTTDGIYIDETYFIDLNLNINNCLFEDNDDDGIELDWIVQREHETSTINIQNSVFIDDDVSTDTGIYINNIEGGDAVVNIRNNEFYGDDQMDAIYWDYTNDDAEDDSADIPIGFVWLNVEDNYFYECDYGLYIYEFYFTDYLINFNYNVMELIDDEAIYVDYFESSAGTFNIIGNDLNQVDDGFYFDYPAYFDDAHDMGYTEAMMRPTYLNFIDNTMLGVEYYGIYVYENYYAPLYVNIDNCHIEGTGDDFSSFYGIYIEYAYYAPIHVDINNSYIAHGYYGYYMYEEDYTYMTTNIENTVFDDVYYGLYMEYPAYYEYHKLTMTDVDINVCYDGTGIEIYYACDDDGAVFDMILDNVNIHAYEGYSWYGDEYDYYDYGIYFDEFDNGRTYLTMTDCDITGYGSGGVYAENFYSAGTLSAWIYDCNFEDFPGEFAPSVYIDADGDEGGAVVYLISCDGDQTYYIYDDDAYYTNYGQYWDSYIYEGWWLDVEVLTGQYLNMAAENVDISVYDTDGSYITGGLTDGTGWVVDMIAYEMVLWSNGIEQNNPFTIVADNGAVTASAVVDIYADTQVTLTLTGDWDADGQNDLIDPDDDNDGVTDVNDAFPQDPAESADSDGDGIGDNADLDDDMDEDGIPDASDWDIDGDQVGNDNDAFPYDGTEWNDMDGDGIGDNTDADIDGDGFNNTAPVNETIPDDFPYDGSEWSDMDGDGVGDNSDWDMDGDLIGNDQDEFPADPTESSDMDGDGIGDNADTDVDGDGISDAADVFPTNPNEWLDTDGDGVGDNSDWDIDGDGVANTNDDFPYGDGEWRDLDGDGLGDGVDSDIDGDGIANVDDAFSFNAEEWTDTDGDGIGDNKDWDVDGDGVSNAMDAFPFITSEWLDTDGDLIGNNADTDDDGDGILDADDEAPLYFNVPATVIPEYPEYPEEQPDIPLYLLLLILIVTMVLVLLATNKVKDNTESPQSDKPETPKAETPEPKAEEPKAEEPKTDLAEE